MSNKTELTNRIRRILKPGTCETCQQAIDFIVKRIIEQEPVVIKLNPDRNCSGRVTHWHIATPGIEPRSQERKQFLFDVFVTALEGGIGYWACADEYHWANKVPEGESKDDIEGFFAIIHDTEADFDPEGEPAFPQSKIDADVIEKGINRILENDQFKINDQIKKNIRDGFNQNDAGYLDADDCDCVVQAGLFNEIVFG